MANVYLPKSPLASDQHILFSTAVLNFVLYYNHHHLSRLVGKPTMWFPNRSDTNQAVRSQKQDRSLKFQIYEEEEVYYLCSENKGADQLRGSFAVTAKLICVFVFAYADCLAAAIIFLYSSTQNDNASM